MDRVSHGARRSWFDVNPKLVRLVSEESTLISKEECVFSPASPVLNSSKQHWQDSFIVRIFSFIQMFKYIFEFVLFKV